MPRRAGPFTVLSATDGAFGKFANGGAGSYVLTTPKRGESILGDVLLVAKNSADKAMTVQYQGSQDGTDWVNVGSAQVLAIGNVTNQFNVQTLSDPWVYLRARVTSQAGSDPTVGAITILGSFREPS